MDLLRELLLDFLRVLRAGFLRAVLLDVPFLLRVLQPFLAAALLFAEEDLLLEVLFAGFLLYVFLRVVRRLAAPRFAEDDLLDAFLFLVRAAFFAAADLFAAFLRLVAAAFFAAALLLALLPLRAGFLLAAVLFVVLLAFVLFRLTDFLRVLAIFVFPRLVVFLVLLEVLRDLRPFGGLTNTSSPSAIDLWDWCHGYEGIVVYCISLATQTHPLALT